MTPGICVIPKNKNVKQEETKEYFMRSFDRLREINKWDVCNPKVFESFVFFF